MERIFFAAFETFRLLKQQGKIILISKNLPPVDEP